MFLFYNLKLITTVNLLMKNCYLVSLFCDRDKISSYLLSLFEIHPI